MYFTKQKKKNQIFLGNMCHWRNFCLDIELFSTTFFSARNQFYRFEARILCLEKINCISNVNRTHKVITTTREKKNLDTQYCWFTFSLMKYAMRNKSNSDEHWTYHTLMTCDTNFLRATWELEQNLCRETCEPRYSWMQTEPQVCWTTAQIDIPDKYLLCHKAVFCFMHQTGQRSIPLMH